MSMITLNGTQWHLVISALNGEAAICDLLGDPESAESAVLMRAIAALTHARLSEQGWTSH
jgi:hypothetical protein